MSPGPERPCPPTESIAEALATAPGGVPPAGAARSVPEAHAVLRHVLRHVATCARCAQVAVALRRVDRALREGAPPEVPAPLRAAAEALPGRAEWERPSPEEAVGSAAEAGPVPALRGEALAASHRLYRVGDYDLDLALLEDRALTGQVLPASEDAPELVDAACVLEGDATVRQAALGPCGEFCIENVAPGRYRLVVETDDRRLVLDDLDLTVEAERK